MSDRTQIEEIKNRLDIVSVVQEYVPTLKKSGRNFFGLCPFHQEKTPSFSVNSELGLFKCFGCGEGGDVIKFIEKIEGIDFPHALEISAKRAGIELKKFSDPKIKEQYKERELILKVNGLGRKYFSYLLNTHTTGQIAREYLKHRNINKIGTQSFQLGFAPTGYENLKTFLKKRGYEEKQLIKWGLLAKGESRSYDKFRNRLMFPIIDHQGDIVGFSGRSIDSNSKAPKYLNSPETAVYNKSKLLFGLYQAKDAIRKQDFVIIVEGNIDVVSSYQVGVKNIVAPLGTALTESQLLLLKRYCTKIYFAFDNDSAGQKALLRSLELAEKVSLQVLIVDIGKYKDVDELINSGGNWQEVVAKSKPVIDFLLKSLVKNYDLSNSKEKATYINKLLIFISKVQDNLEQVDYIEKLARKVHIDRDILITRLKEFSKEHTTPTTKPKTPEVFRLTEETYLLSLLIQHPQWIDSAQKLKPEELFLNKDNIILFERILEKKNIPKSLLTLYQNIALSSKSTFNSKTEFMNELTIIHKRLRKLFIHFKISQLEATSENQKAIEELLQLSNKLREVQ